VHPAQRAIEALPAAVMIIDVSDTILIWNAAAEQMFDIPTAHALARKFRDLDVSYRVEGLRARIEDMKARHTPSHMENTTFSRRDGREMHADITIAPLTDGARTFGVLVFAIDATEHARLREEMTRVTEQHATAIEELQSTNEELETTNEELQSTNEELETTVEELQAANAELASLNAELEARTAEFNRLDSQHSGVINTLDTAIVVLDRSGAVRTWNKAAERMWLLHADQVLHRDFFTLPVPGIARLPREPFERVLQGAPTESIPDVAYTLEGGRPGRAALRLTPLVDAQGTIGGIVAFLLPANGPTS
jgi:two-component system CheB/CheR fusion protein